MRWVAVALATLLAGTCAGGADGKDPRRRIDVGGYSLAIRCTGRGSPTVVLEAGYGLPSAYWARLHPRLRRTRVCSYDRAGLGRSDRRPSGARAETPAEELHALLRRAGVRPPLVLVGHSYGGLLVRVYEATYRGQVRGLVLLDAVHPAALGAGYVQEGRSVVNAGEMARRIRARGKLALPVVVLERGRNRDPAWSELQRSLGRASTNAVHAVALTSYHSIHQGQPSLVVRAIQAVRRGGRLPACTTLFVRERVRCVR